jgi:hypothetical protein
VSTGGKATLLDEGGDDGDVEYGPGKAEAKGDDCGGANGPEADRVRLCPCAKVGLRGDDAAGTVYALTLRRLLNIVRSGLGEREMECRRRGSGDGGAPGMGRLGTVAERGRGQDDRAVAAGFVRCWNNDLVILEVPARLAPVYIAHRHNQGWQSPITSVCSANQ